MKVNTAVKSYVNSTRQYSVTADEWEIILLSHRALLRKFVRSDYFHVRIYQDLRENQGPEVHVTIVSIEPPVSRN